jgi:GDPmannose 4,6-dehydratase
MAQKTALVTGVTGQDGSYLSELLLSKGYKVHGLIRRSSSFNTGRVDHLMSNRNFTLHYCDLTDSNRVFQLLATIKPDEIYNLGAQSHVMVSFHEAVFTADVNYLSVASLLESIRSLKMAFPEHHVKFYQAGTSEMFGDAKPPQSEATPFEPCSPYAVAKVGAHMLVDVYRKSYGLFLTNGILFNHESPRRGETFVTRKITRALTRIKLGLQSKVVLGNLKAKRDWGFAGDYVEAMWLMLQQDKPGDFVVATGESHSVEEFLEECCKVLDMGDWHQYVELDPKYCRPKEVEYLLGDSTKARQALGWTPRTSFTQLCKLMCDSDLELARKELHAKQMPNA